MNASFSALAALNEAFIASRHDFELVNAGFVRFRAVKEMLWLTVARRP
jgi:hypothetical protein